MPSRRGGSNGALQTSRGPRRGSGRNGGGAIRSCRADRCGARRHHGRHHREGLLHWNGAWAVGTYTSSPSGKAQALLLHWNGTSWRQVALPHFGPKGEPNMLNSISASPAGNVVAAGYYSGHAGAGQQALVFRVP